MEIDWKKHLRYLDNREIQNDADNFRSEYWKNEIPVDIELILENKLGFFITPVDGLRKTCGTDAMLLSNM